MKLTKQLIDAGFAPPSDQQYRRLVIATVGEASPATPSGEKSGKTTWALGGPQPVFVIGTDTGTDEIARKKRAEGMEIYCDLIETPEIANDASPKQRAQIYEPIWEKAKDAITMVINNPEIRTLVVDTASELWEMCRLARFGKLAQVMPTDYGPVNAEFRELIKRCYDREDLVSVWTHKNKKEYMAKTTSKGTVDSWTGKWERAGFGDTGSLVDVNGVNYFYRRESRGEDGSVIVDRGFGFRVLNARQNMLDLEGLEFEGLACNFQTLAMEAFPGTMPEEWI